MLYEILRIKKIDDKLPKLYSSKFRILKILKIKNFFKKSKDSKIAAFEKIPELTNSNSDQNNVDFNDFKIRKIEGIKKNLYIQYLFFSSFLLCVNDM